MSSDEFPNFPLFNNCYLAPKMKLCEGVFLPDKADIIEFVSCASTGERTRKSAKLNCVSVSPRSKGPTINDICKMKQGYNIMRNNDGDG